MTYKHPVEIVILSGEQAGAHTQLDYDTPLTVSGNLDTDIVIRDQTINDEKVELTLSGEGTFLQVISGVVQVNGQAIEQKKRQKLSKNATIKIGETIFACRDKSSDTEEEKLSGNSNEELSETNSENSLGNGYAQRVISISFFALFCIVITIIAALRLSESDDVSGNMSNAEYIQNMLTENGIATLQVAENGHDQFLLSGFVMTNKERANIERFVDEHKIPAMLDLEVGEQMATEVRELFRVNGIEANTYTSEAGRVVVEIKDVDKETAEDIEIVALKEVSKLDELVFVFKESEESANTIEPNIQYRGEDKRITMVVDGDPAYIVTSDHAKYYIGALLPTGYRIVDIVEQDVVLEKHGKQTTLSF